MSEHRIIFVGGERHKGYVDLLNNTLKGNWRTENYSNVKDAVTALKSDSFNAVGIILNPSDQSAADFLKMAEDEYPEMVRCLFFDPADREAALRAVYKCHLCFPITIDPKQFRLKLENSIKLRSQLTDTSLLARISGIKTLPSPPELYNQIVHVMESENASLVSIGNLIGKDIGLSIELLRMVNSAFFGLSQHVENVQHAINLLGLDTVKNIVFSVGVFKQFDKLDQSICSLETINNRSILVGAKAKLLSTSFGLDRSMVEDSLMAGMLHDIGKLIMVANFKDELRAALKLAEESQKSLYRAEVEILGVDDATIGAYLLSLWGFPDTIVEAVAYHYTPGQTMNPMLSPLTAVHLAYATNEDIENPRPKSMVDLEYVTALGIAEQIEEIRNFCQAAMV